jgi:anti-sigma B factor antagonist
MAGIQCTERIESGVFVLTIVDRKIDLFNSDALKERLLTHLNSGVTRLIVNLKNVEFMDSAGLLAIINPSLEAQKINSQLCVTDLTDYNQTLFQLNNLETHLRIYDSEREAIESMT